LDNRGTVSFPRKKIEMKKGAESVETRKADLISKLKGTRQKILDAAASLPAERASEKFLGSWSAMDLLAHLAGWDETNIQAGKEILRGELPSFYAEHDRDWATYNAKLVEEFGKETLEDQLALTRQTHKKLMDYVNELPAEDLWADRGIRARGWKVTIGRLLEAELSDEEEHYEQLNRFLEAGGSS
jgi:hypothetical protein